MESDTSSVVYGGDSFFDSDGAVGGVRRVHLSIQFSLEQKRQKIDLEGVKVHGGKSWAQL